MRRDPKDLLAEIVAADELADEPQVFVVGYSWDGPVIIGHPGWPEDQKAPADVEIDELAERGWVRIDLVEGRQRNFALTVKGREAAMAHARQRAAVGASAVLLDWQAVTPVLEAFYAAYEGAGAPEYGVGTEVVLRETDDPAAARAALRELVRNGYLETTAEDDQGDVPITVRPTHDTMKLLAGWPGGNAEAALDEIVAALDRAIEASEPGEEQSKLVKLREGILGAGRAVLIAYLEKKVGV